MLLAVVLSLLTRPFVRLQISSWARLPRAPAICRLRRPHAQSIAIFVIAVVISWPRSLQAKALVFRPARPLPVLQSSEARLVPIN